MIGEIIAVGDELTSGQRLDTNSQWLSERLGECGIQVLYHATVADDLPAMVQVFRTASQRADVVVSTGGLGPTADDLTRDALAGLAGVELQEDSASLRHIEALFRARRREMPERNRIQAMFPAGSTPIPNRHGTAPGIDIRLAGEEGRSCRWFALPGVPAEMYDMWREAVAPAVRALLPEPRIIMHRRIKCFGAGESRIEELLPDLIRRGREPTVGITASRGTITLRITASGASPAACEEGMLPTLQTIRETLGDLVLGEEDEELEHAVTCLLRARRATLATVEVGTEGEIARSLSQVGGSLFAAGWVGNQVAKLATTLWGDAGEVPVAVRGDNTEGLAEQMADRARNVAGADLSLVTLAPVTATTTKQDAQVVVAIAHAQGGLTRRFPFAAHPAIQHILAAKRALNELRLFLTSR